MSQVVAVNAKTLEHIASQLDELTKEVKELKEKIIDHEPPHGTKAWWDWSERKADEDIKKGNVVTFSSVKEMQKHLDSLK
jgi:hypothetical protein